MRYYQHHDTSIDEASARPPPPSTATGSALIFELEGRIRSGNLTLSPTIEETDPDE